MHSDLAGDTASVRLGKRKSHSYLGYMVPWPELLDERGYRMAPSIHTSINGFGNSGTPEFMELRSFPRRGREIHVRFYDGQTGIAVGDYVIANPAPGPYPTWNPEPLPTNRINGPLAVSLIRLQSGVRDERAKRPATQGDLGYARATFLIKENGQATRDWEPVAVTVSDATGNQADNALSRVSKKGDETALDFDCSLSPSEAAWKLRVELSRNARAKLSPDEYFDVRGVPVPAPEKKTTVSREAVIQGVRVRLDSVSGADRAWFWPRVCKTPQLSGGHPPQPLF